MTGTPLSANSCLLQDSGRFLHSMRAGDREPSPHLSALAWRPSPKAGWPRIPTSRMLQHLTLRLLPHCQA